MAKKYRYAIDGADWSPQDPRFSEAFITTERIREEMRIPIGDNGHDDFLRSIVKDALLTIQENTALPILLQKVSAVFEQDAGAQDYRIDFDPFLYEVERIRYSPAGATRGIFTRDLETDAIDTPASTAGDSSPLAGEAVIEATNGFPAAEAGEFQITYTRGLDRTDWRIGSLRTMLILMARKVYDGESQIQSKHRSLYDRLLERTINLNPLPPQFKPLGAENAA